MPGDETEPKKAESPVAAKPKPPEAAPGQVCIVPPRPPLSLDPGLRSGPALAGFDGEWQAQVPASQQPWGGIAMLAHCAQNVEEESPAHPPAAKDGAPAPAPKPTSKKEHDSNYSRKEKSLGLLCDRFLQEYSSQPEVCAGPRPHVGSGLVHMHLHSCARDAVCPSRCLLPHPACSERS